MNTVPAQLWVGNAQICQTKIITYLQSQWCSTICGHCLSCLQIQERKHHALLWITPEKQYTRAQLEPIFKQTTFALEKHEKYFFVLAYADQLTAACANSLLKLLEEPPQGYHFLLFSERPGAMLATIKSRCLIHKVAQHDSKQADLPPHFQPIVDYLLNPRFHDLKNFAAILDVHPVTEQEILPLLDVLIKQHINKISTLKQIRYNVKHINSIENFYEILPMPGSAKTFLKTLFLRLALEVDSV